MHTAGALTAQLNSDKTPRSLTTEDGLMTLRFMVISELTYDTKLFYIYILHYISRWQISDILNFRGSIMDSLNSYRSSIETIDLSSA